MGWFSRKKSQQPDAATGRASSQPDGVDTFDEATDGGWSDAPDVIASGGGSQADYVHDQLKCACRYLKQPLSFFSALGISIKSSRRYLWIQSTI